MDERIKLLLERTQDKAQKYDELNRLLEYPEVSADKKYYFSLLRQCKAIEKTAIARRELVQCLSELSFYEEFLKEAMQSEREEVEKARLQKLSELQQKADNLQSAERVQAVGEEGAIIELSFSPAVLNEVEQIVEAYCVFAKKCDMIAQNTFKKGRVIIDINSRGAYSLLKDESGAYKIVKEGICDLSVTVVPSVSKEAELNLKDVEFDLLRASGSGGQNINKVETAVRARHIPTGITALCRDERSQLQNKERALQNLKIKLANLQEQEIDRAKQKALEMVAECKKSGKYKRIYDFEKDEIKIGNKMTNLSQALKDGFDREINGIY